MSSDDILNARIRRNLRKKGNLNLPREALQRKIMNRIMSILMSLQNTGVHHNQLAEYIRIDRKTLRRYMEPLIKKGLATRELDKHGKYFPRTKRHRGTSISAEILAESFTERFLGYNEFVLDSPYFRKGIPSDEFELEDALFNFSNVVGGWITYILIQSMNPANKLADHIKDVTENNALIQSWIGDAFSLIQPYLLFNLNYCINNRLETLYKRASGLKDEKSRAKIFLNFLFDRKLFVLDDEIASELNDAFSNLYPNLSRELEKIRAELPMLVRREIDKMNSYAEKIRRQKLCKPHEYTLESDYDEFRVLKCKKCEKKERR